MNDPIPTEIRTERRCAVGREIERFEAHIRAGQPGDLISLAAAEYQPLEPLLGIGRADFESGSENLPFSVRTGGLLAVRRRNITAILFDSLVGFFKHRIG